VTGVKLLTYFTPSRYETDTNRHSEDNSPIYADTPWSNGDISEDNGDNYSESPMSPAEFDRGNQFRQVHKTPLHCWW